MLYYAKSIKDQLPARPRKHKIEHTSKQYCLPLHKYVLFFSHLFFPIAQQKLEGKKEKSKQWQMMLVVKNMVLRL
jgi:hypothetical protein